MSRTHISVALRQLVRERANFRCEYCLVREEDLFLPYSIDHIIAEQHGGTTASENLALACLHCNRKKGPNIASVDLDNGEIVPLFHPRRHRWQDHFRLINEYIEPTSAIGRVTVQLLRLNDPERIQIRQILIDTGAYP